MTVSVEQGLYRPAFERDSCGFGLIASLAGRESHWLVATAVAALARLTHRGAVAADGKTGDGCGILFSTPEPFLRAVATDFFNMSRSVVVNRVTARNASLSISALACGAGNALR